MLQTVFKETETFLDLKKVFRINRSDSMHPKFIDKLGRYNKNTISI
ncbi:hypothetical protein [Psychroserpens sp.]